MRPEIILYCLKSLSKNERIAQLHKEVTEVYDDKMREDFFKKFEDCRNIVDVIHELTDGGYYDN